MCITIATKLSQERNFDIHSPRTHIGEKPYKCSHCNKAFAGKRNLHIHRRTLTEENPYNCSQCEKAFSKKGNLEIHTNKHTVENPFSMIYQI